MNAIFEAMFAVVFLVLAGARIYFEIAHHRARHPKQPGAQQPPRAL